MTSTIKMTNSGTNTTDGGYCKMGDGTLIQWGSATVPSGSYLVDVPFPIDFVNRAQLTIQVTPLQGGTDWNVIYTETSVSKTRIGRTPNTSASTYYWLAIGRWK